MGIKFLLRFQTLPWCFPTPGAAQIPCAHVHDPHRESPPLTIKLIKFDGSLQTYDKPINASQLMTEHPKHLICPTDSFYIGQKIPALSESDTLQLGQQYFLLPRHVFQNDLSFVSFARLINPPAGFHPFDIQKTASGRIRVRISEEFISRLVMRSEGGVEVLCNTPQLKKEYSQLVGGARCGWKPKLEPIRESSKEARRITKNSSNKRKSIGYTASFRFRTPKSHKTVLELGGGGPNGNFRRVVSESVGGPDKKGCSSNKVKSVKLRSRKC